MLNFKIAWRNIFRHGGKSIVVGIILFLGSFIMTFGNGVASGMENGLKVNFGQMMVGDILIASTNIKNKSTIFFGNTMVGDFVQPTPLISDYFEVEKVLENNEYIKDFLPLGKNGAWFLDEESELSTGAVLFGVDFLRYQEYFMTNIFASEGRLITNNKERGFIMMYATRRNTYNYIDATKWYIPAGLKPDTNYFEPGMTENIDGIRMISNIILMGLSDKSTLDIQVPILGIGSYKNLNAFMDAICFIDIQSFRETFNYILDNEELDLSKDQEELLSIDSEDIGSLFGESDVIGEASINKANYSTAEIQKQTVKSTNYIETDSGAYNMISVKIKNYNKLKKAVDDLNMKFKEKNLDAQAVDWETGSQPISQFSDFLKIIIHVFVTFIFFVAIIIIMNTLSMAAMERTNEIGMMKAIGASNGFIKLMFMSETFLLSFFFGGMGILAGLGLMEIFTQLNITSGNEYAQMLFGGDTFRPLLNIVDIFICIVQLLFVTIISVLYPLHLASKISPLDSIMKE